MSKRARSGAVAAFLVLLAGLALAACGSSSSSSGSNASSSSAGAGTTTGTTPAGTPAGGGSGARRGGLFASLTATQKSCLTSHGVTLPSTSGGFRPGASGTGSGSSSTTPTGTPPGSGASGAAGPPSGGTSTTGHFPGAGGFAGRSSKFATAFKACGIKLDTHFGGGFAGGAGPGGSSARPTAAALKTFVACVDKNGYDLRDSQLNTRGSGSILPKSLETNTAFTKAAQPCARDLFAGGAGAGAGAGGAGAGPSGAGATPPASAGASAS